jgi:HSP20 family protein
MPFSVSGLQDEVNRLMEKLWHAGVSTRPLDGQEWAPAVDLYEHPEQYTLLVEIPGVDPSEIEVTHVGATLTIRGSKAAPDETSEEQRPLRRERRFGTFCRTVELPGDIDAERLSARCHGGVLTIVVPKSEASRARSVRVEVQED